ncbi:MAG: M23 family metallopeptidase [Oscillospiraceae bacterium]|nr:M23 family metallopeptidase [Oscillospiraceae bacterium]
MQTTYGRESRQERSRKQRRQRRAVRQLRQLLVCLAVFALVFVGKGVWPEQTARMGQQLLQMLHANTDVRGLFVGLGSVLSGEETSWRELGELCVAVFAPGGRQEQWHYTPRQQPIYSPMWREQEQGAVPVSVQEPEPEQKPEPEPALAAGAVVQEVDYNGAPPPEGYSMQWLSLGAQHIATPVFGSVTSAYGYREHPILGQDGFHTGVDVAASEGERINAFADGTVTQVGENEDHGRYVRIAHESGVESFYAHCSAITVSEGDRVQVGQQVAQVGSTGRSTGPHLHFEVRLNGMGLDPLRYIDPEGNGLALG